MRELIVDLFAGGGGASEGIEWALQAMHEQGLTDELLHVDIAVNHDPIALAMHAMNHPRTLHLPHNVWKVAPHDVCNGFPVGLLWLSPDCTHFSKAKGSKPVKKHIRDLAWVGVRWAREIRPRLIMLENVEEWVTWGPVVDGRPCPMRKGQTFKRFCRALRAEGYKFAWTERRACNAGAPTIRKRLFFIARRDGDPIIFTKPKHGPADSPDVVSGKLKPYRTAADSVIDWSLPCPSIFASEEEIMRDYGLRAIRPLADATMARIARGVDRYVINSAKPFIVPITHVGDLRTYSVDEPVRTVTTAHRGEQALITPVLAGVGSRAGQSPERPVNAPFATITATKRGQHAIVAPVIVRTAHGDQDSKGKRRGRGSQSVEEPTPSVLGTRDAAVAAAFITKMRKRSIGQSVDDPLCTVTTAHSDHHPGGSVPIGVVTPFMVPRYGERPGQEPRTHSVELVSAFLAQHNTDVVGHDAREPVSTIVQKGCTQAVVSAGLVSMKGSDRRGGSVEQPAPSITAQGWHLAETRAFLIKYHDSGGQHAACDDPAPTVDTHGRIGGVTILGEPWQIVDIGMRMLSPPELFRAQGFGRRPYIINRGVIIDDEHRKMLEAWEPGGRKGGKPAKSGKRRKTLLDRIQVDADGTFPISKTDQIRCCGNSVSPFEPEDLVLANYRPREVTVTERPVFVLEAAE